MLMDFRCCINLIFSRKCLLDFFSFQYQYYQYTEYASFSLTLYWPRKTSTFINQVVLALMYLINVFLQAIEFFIANILSFATRTLNNSLLYICYPILNDTKQKKCCDMETGSKWTNNNATGSGHCHRDMSCVPLSAISQLIQLDVV